MTAYAAAVPGPARARARAPKTAACTTITCQGTAASACTSPRTEMVTTKTTAMKGSAVMNQNRLSRIIRGRSK